MVANLQSKTKRGRPRKPDAELSAHALKCRNRYSINANTIARRDYEERRKTNQLHRGGTKRLPLELLSENTLKRRRRELLDGPDIADPYFISSKCGYPEPSIEANQAYIEEVRVGVGYFWAQTDKGRPGVEPQLPCEWDYDWLNNINHVCAFNGRAKSRVMGQ